MYLHFGCSLSQGFLLSISLLVLFALGQIHIRCHPSIIPKNLYRFIFAEVFFPLHLCTSPGAECGTSTIGHRPGAARPTALRQSPTASLHLPATALPYEH